VSLTAHRAVWVAVSCSAVACAGDAVPEAPPLTLAEASEQVTFASTEMLGPHRFLATSTRVESRYDSELSRHEETIEVRWQDWDNFRYERSVDGRSVEAVVVSGGRGWTQRGRSWSSVADAELYRTQLRMTWNAWDQGTRSFGERLALSASEADTVEGRPARRYTVSLAEATVADAPGPRTQGKMDPRSLSGVLWVDEATAVRLMAQLDGVLSRDGYTQELRLQLARTEVGVTQEIEPPVAGKEQEQ